MRPLSARSTTRCERRTASAAEVSTSRSEVAISSIDAEVSSAALASASVFSDTCFTERTICSIELDTSSTFDESRLAVSLSSAPEAPSSRIELLDSSMLSLSAELDCAMPETWALICSMLSAARRVPCSCSTVATESVRHTGPSALARASRPSADDATLAIVVRSASTMPSNERVRSPSSSSDSNVGAGRRSPEASRSAAARRIATGVETSRAMK